MIYFCKCFEMDKLAVIVPFQSLLTCSHFLPSLWIHVWKLSCYKNGSLLPDAYLHLVRKRQLISDWIKGPLVAACRSPLMKALDRSVETMGLWIVTSSVTFIKSVNQSSIKPCLNILYICIKYELDVFNRFFKSILSFKLVCLFLTIYQYTW